LILSEVPSIIASSVHGSKFEKEQILDPGYWILDKDKHASRSGTEYLSSIEHPVSSIEVKFTEITTSVAPRKSRAYQAVEKQVSARQPRRAAFGQRSIRHSM